MAKKEEVVPEEEPLTNGIEEHPEDMFLTASVTVNLHVADVLGKPVETEEDRQLFLAVISSFFQSEIVYEQLKMFVRFNMNPQTPPESQIVVPERKILVP
jgi:hypothetical protein